MQDANFIKPRIRSGLAKQKKRPISKITTKIITITTATATEKPHTLYISISKLIVTDHRSILYLIPVT
jgi:hypothetical protein